MWMMKKKNKLKIHYWNFVAYFSSFCLCHFSVFKTKTIINEKVERKKTHFFLGKKNYFSSFTFDFGVCWFFLLDDVWTSTRKKNYCIRLMGISCWFFLFPSEYCVTRWYYYFSYAVSFLIPFIISLFFFSIVFRLHVFFRSICMSFQKVKMMIFFYSFYQ